MASKANFKSEEWELMRNAADWVYVYLGLVEGRSAMMGRVGEAKGYAEALKNYQTNDPLIREVIAGSGQPRDPVQTANQASAQGALTEIGELLDRRLSPPEAEAFREFLMSIGRAVAGATGEGLFGLGKKVSSKEEAALDKIAVALRATAADTEARVQAAEKAKRDAEAKAKQEAEEARRQKQAAEAKARAEAAEKAKREAEAKAKQEAEEARRQKQAAEAKARAEAAQAQAAEKVRREAEAKAKQEAEEARRQKEAAEAKAQAEAAEQARQKAEAERQKQAAEAKAQAEAAEQARQKAAAARPVMTASQASAPAAAPAPAVIAQHTVVPGDTLSGIAQKYYGSAAKWPQIYEANKAVIGANPNLIRPGQVFQIPKLPE